MAELPERDAALLLDMLLAARDARSFVENLDEAGFLASRLHQNAAFRSVEVIGEAAGKVSAATSAAHPEIPWREITGMRHRLIHGYGEVRLDLGWMVLRDRLGPLISVLEAHRSRRERGRSMMNAERLLNYYEIIADAPDAIAPCAASFPTCPCAANSCRRTQATNRRRSC
ncbi:hypothetical protein BH23GEM3_BH23GEM3_03920 [soil metagenome]